MMKRQIVLKTLLDLHLGFQLEVDGVSGCVSKVNFERGTFLLGKWDGEVLEPLQTFPFSRVKGRKVWEVTHERRWPCVHESILPEVLSN